MFNKATKNKSLKVFSNTKFNFSEYKFPCDEHINYLYYNTHKTMKVNDVAYALENQMDKNNQLYLTPFI